MVYRPSEVYGTGAALASRVVVDYHNAPQVRQAMLWVMVQAGIQDVGIAVPREKLLPPVVPLRCFRIPPSGLSEVNHALQR